jgi:hypothetical protein
MKRLFKLVYDSEKTDQLESEARLQQVLEMFASQPRHNWLAFRIKQ